MYKAIREIRDTFVAKGLKHSVDEVGGAWVLRAGVSGDAASYSFLFIKQDDEDNDVSLRVFDVVKFPEHKKDKGLEVLAKLGRQYRFIRFAMNDEGEVNAEYDFPMEFSPIGEGAFEMMVRFTDILDNCYPELMRAIWA